MRPVGRPPLYPAQPARSCLATEGGVRLVARQHCFYRVSQKPQRPLHSVVWCRPISPEAVVWMRDRGMDAQRIVCQEGEVDVWIARQERAIHATRRMVLGNILPAPKRRAP